MSLKILTDQLKRTTTLLNSFRKINLKEYPIGDDNFLTTKEVKNIVREKIEENRGVIENLLKRVVDEIERRRSGEIRYRELLKINSEYDFILNNKEMEDNYESTKIYQQKYDEQMKIYEELKKTEFVIDENFLVEKVEERETEEEVVQMLNMKIKSEKITDEKIVFLTGLYEFLRK